MFTGPIEDAVHYYLSRFPDGALGSLERYGSGEDGSERSVKRATFRIAGQSIMCIDSQIVSFDRRWLSR
jgi:predicted 3-demethylubiquinone-9 3-methyltransferase (glyoxalase superfamily)